MSSPLSEQDFLKPILLDVAYHAGQDWKKRNQAALGDLPVMHWRDTFSEETIQEIVLTYQEMLRAIPLFIIIFT